MHFKSEVLLMPLKQEYQVSAFWMWADNQVKEWHNQQLNNCSASDQLLFFYPRVNTVDKAKYVEHRHTKKTPNNKSKQNWWLHTHWGEPSLFSTANVGYERNSCEGKFLWERNAGHHGQGALPGWAGRVGVIGVTAFPAVTPCSLEWELNQPEISKEGQGRCGKLRLMVSFWWFKYRFQYLRLSK